MAGDREPAEQAGKDEEDAGDLADLTWSEMRPSRAFRAG
jgi:hypothetical protein